ncbi:MAG: dUTP diphosphatase [Kiritimatiellae bacterium]|nr:dUTP diphosphatase [Kiritimatiellia bacterium]
MTPAVKLSVKRIHPDAVLPAYAHPGDAGMDVRSVADIAIEPGSRALVPTGLVFVLPPGWEAQVRPRSGLALKHGVTVLNTPGTVDSGYRGEIGVILFNSSAETFRVSKGDRIAQIVVSPAVQAEICETDDLDATDRGAGGFGSTGKS